MSPGMIILSSCYPITFTHHLNLLMCSCCSSNEMWSTAYLNHCIHSLSSSPLSLLSKLIKMCCITSAILLTVPPHGCRNLSSLQHVIVRIFQNSSLKYSCINIFRCFFFVLTFFFNLAQCNGHTCMSSMLFFKRKQFILLFIITANSPLSHICIFVVGSGSWWHILPEIWNYLWWQLGSGSQSKALGWKAHVPAEGY